MQYDQEYGPAEMIKPAEKCTLFCGFRYLPRYFYLPVNIFLTQATATAGIHDCNISVTAEPGMGLGEP